MFGPTVWVAGVGCAAAVMFAAHSARDGRGEAVGLACLTLVNWALFVLAYTDYSPSWALQRAGFDVSSVHLWMLADAICGSAAAMLAFRHWWGFALWGVALAKIGFHAGMDAQLYDPGFYVDVLLNAGLLVQLAIFFAIGGGGVASLLRNITRRLRNIRHSRAAASQKTRAGPR